MRVASFGSSAARALVLEYERYGLIFDCFALPCLSHQASSQISVHQTLGQQHHSTAAVALVVPDYAGLIENVQIDVILLSSPWALLGLPYLQHLLQAKGRDLPLHTYCTEPCLHFFQQLSQELLDLQSCLRRPSQSGHHDHQQHAATEQHMVVTAAGTAAVLHKDPTPIPQTDPQLEPVQHTSQQGETEIQQAEGVKHLQHTTSRQANHAERPQEPATTGTTQPRPQQLSASTDHPPSPTSTAQPDAAAVAPADLVSTAGQLIVSLFDPQQLQCTLDAVHIVRLGERVELPGDWGMTVEARPSGSGIGNCLWAFTRGNQRYTYLSSASMQQGPSAALHAPALHNLDVLLLGDGCLTHQGGVQGAAQQHDRPCWEAPVQTAGQADRQQGRGAADELQAALQAAARVVALGGSVLVPVVAGAGAALHVLEHLSAALAAAGSAASGAPLFYLSSAAADALATANSCCEYLAYSWQQQVLQHGEEPFVAQSLVRSGRLHILAPCGQGRQAVYGAAALQPLELQVPVAAAATDAATRGVDTGAAALTQPLDLDVNMADGATAESVEQSSDDVWSSAVHQVLAAGPCVVLVPLWSLAAGPGAQLAKAWHSNPANMLLLTESQSLSRQWLQQCCRQQLLPPQQQWQWHVLYAPLSCRGSHEHTHAGNGALPWSLGAQVSSAKQEGRAAASMQGTLQGCLTPSELLEVLNGAGQTVTGPHCSLTGGLADKECQVVGSSENVKALQAAQRALSPARSASTQQLRYLPADSAVIQDTAVCSAVQTRTCRLLWQELELPPPLVLASLSADVAERLHLQPMRVTRDLPAPDAAHPAAAADTQPSLLEHVGQEVSAARLQALLTRKSGKWLLEALPTGPRLEAVSTVLAYQQQPREQLLWGSIEATKLLQELQAAGFTAAPLDTQGSTPCAVISVNNGAAHLRLADGETEVECDDTFMRQQLLQCVLSQLHHIT